MRFEVDARLDCNALSGSYKASYGGPLAGRSYNPRGDDTVEVVLPETRYEGTISGRGGKLVAGFFTATGDLGDRAGTVDGMLLDARPTLAWDIATGVNVAWRHDCPGTVARTAVELPVGRARFLLAVSGTVIDPASGALVGALDGEMQSTDKDGTLVRSVMAGPYHVHASAGSVYLTSQGRHLAIRLWTRDDRLAHAQVWESNYGYNGFGNVPALAQIECPADGYLYITASANSAMCWYFDGVSVYDRTRLGNVSQFTDLEAHPFAVRVTAGRHTLAVQVRPSSSGWNFRSLGGFSRQRGDQLAEFQVESRHPREGLDLRLQPCFRELPHWPTMRLQWRARVRANAEPLQEIVSDLPGTAEAAAAAALLESLADAAPADPSLERRSLTVGPGCREVESGLHHRGNTRRWPSRRMAWPPTVTMSPSTFTAGAGPFWTVMTTR